MSYTLQYGGSLGASFPAQFPKASISFISMTVVLIEQLAKDGSGRTVSHGTGFMWRASDGLWLITARHVLTGLNPFDDSPLSPNLFEPSEIKVNFGVGSANHFGRDARILPLRDGKGSPRWADDPEFAKLRTDIAALPIDIGRSDVFCINDDPAFGQFDDMFTQVGFQCFVIGYPTTMVTGLMLPIWRSGALASDPVVPIDNKPIFLVDAATGPGFSGSPVWRMQIGPTAFHDASQPTDIRIEGDAVVRASFVGVYAGRLSHPHIGAQTPYVFYANRIPLILAANIGLARVRPR
ncbi:S1 family peptidase [Sphingomonas sp. RB1R13]|uniref:S1 family peptidase n=1 Tax=Sphingomonas sp. RB1R13 TaxID=3096159 RepID=UPI002FCAE9D0